MPLIVLIAIFVAFWSPERAGGPARRWASEAGAVRALATMAVVAVVGLASAAFGSLLARQATREGAGRAPASAACPGQPDARRALPWSASPW